MNRGEEIESKNCLNAKAQRKAIHGFDLLCAFALGF